MTTIKGKRVQVFQTKAQLVRATVNRIIHTIERSVRTTGRCSIVLAGGNTPRDVYGMLACSPSKNRINWDLLHLFWGDERAVPPDHPDSNFHMVHEALLGHITIPQENIHRIFGELGPRKAASRYSDELEQYFLGQAKKFDLILLGLGEDGHTASIFPRTEAVSEATKSVGAVFVPQLKAWRVTMMLPLINAAKSIIFLISGSEKSQIVRNLMDLQSPESRWPASMVQPEDGSLHWFLDSSAASLIEANDSLMGE